MSSDFKSGDKVRWNTPQGETHGVVQRKETKTVTAGGTKLKGSEDDPLAPDDETGLDDRIDHGLRSTERDSLGERRTNHRVSRLFLCLAQGDDFEVNHFRRGGPVCPPEPFSRGQGTRPLSDSYNRFGLCDSLACSGVRTSGKEWISISEPHECVRPSVRRVSGADEHSGARGHPLRAERGLRERCGHREEQHRSVRDFGTDPVVAA
jgi:hypothetical protein